MSLRLPSGRKLLAYYLVVLTASYLWQHFFSKAPGDHGTRVTVENTAIAYADSLASSPEEAPPLVLIHGLPFDRDGWGDLPSLLGDHFRVITFDLPGFGDSAGEELEDYSIEAQAQRLDQFLEGLGIAQAHLVGHGFGGGIALELYETNPQRVASLTLISASGVQELELLGDYTLNHAVHGAHLFYVWLFYTGVPHFGALDDARYNETFARSHYDTDHRPLRDIFRTVDVPTLIVHGEKNLRVPLAAAKEHARLVPHSETYFIPGAGRSLLPDHSAAISARIQRFASENHDTRSEATPARAEASTAPFDYNSYEKDLRARVLFIVILLAIATLVSEDITCITAGLLVSQGAVGYFPATLGCFLGIFIGDTGLYLLGRVLGVRALKIPPLKWFIDAHKIERSKHFFHRYGPFLIVVTRWLPGTRIPTYVAAGMLKLPLFKFMFYFLAAAIIWTPALVGISTVIGVRLLGWLHKFEDHALLVLVLAIATLLFVVHLALALATHRGRQLLKAKWQRRLNWRFWPTWLTRLPLLPRLVQESLRRRQIVRLVQPETGLPPLEVTGDGDRSLEFLILDDPEVRPYAKQLFDEYTQIIDDVPPAGEAVSLPAATRVDNSQSYLQYLSRLKRQLRPRPPQNSNPTPPAE